MPRPGRGYASAVDAIELLRADHEQVLIMLAELADAPAVVGVDQLRARKELVTRLVIAESQHEAVEEQHFWPMVRTALPDGPQLADRAVAQEDDAKELLAALDKADPAQPDFEDMVRRIIDAGRAHIDYEQTKVWPNVLGTVDKDTLAELGARMARAKHTAPTRPHPGSSKATSVVAAAADRLRDALAGRGR